MRIGAAADFDGLYKIAEKQCGFFTSVQARHFGYSQQLQAYYVSKGEWQRKSRGVFLLKHYPAPFLQDDLYLTYLWTCSRSGTMEGIFSHGTALYLHEISTFVPRIFHLSVPRHFRRHSQPPFRVKLFKRDLEEANCEVLRGLKVTKPLRTIVDLLDSKVIDGDYVDDGLTQALLRVLITHSEMRKAELTVSERAALCRALERIKYDRIDEIRQRH